MINGGVTTIHVTDLDRAVAFYSESLGLKLIGRHGNRWATVDAGAGFYLGLRTTSEKGPPGGQAGSITLGFDVDEPIEKVVQRLVARGVEFRGPVREDTESRLKLAYFRDPDGNELYLCQSHGRG